MKRIKVYFLILALIVNAPATFASDVNLTAQERSSLDKIGVNREELGQMVQQGDFSELEAKLDQIKIENKDWDKKGKEKVEGLKSKFNEAKDGLESEAQQVQDDLKSEAKGIAQGYAASTLSLIMLAVFAPSVVMACRTKPSALAYAGTAAVYLTRELMNSRKFKASALSEIKYVELKLDKSQSLDSNIQTAKKGLNMQFEFIQSYKKLIDKGLKSLQDKAENAKLASIGFASASAIALTETYAFDAGGCVKSGEPTAPSASVKDALSALFLAKAFAKQAKDPQVEVKKKMLVKSLKDNKLADLASDSDKILAVLVGGASIAAAIFIPSYAKILNSIVSNGLSRSVVFAAHGLIAFSVYKALSKSSEKLMERSEQLQKLLDKAKSAGNKGLDTLSSKLNSEEVRSTLQQIGVDKSAGEMSPEEIEKLIKGIDTEDIEQNFKDKLPSDLPGTSYLRSLTELLWPKAHAKNQQTRVVLRCYSPKRCPAPRFPTFQQSKLKALSALTSNFQKYAREVYSNNLEGSSRARRFLLRNESSVAKLQSRLYRQVVKRNPALLSGTKAASFDKRVESKAQEILKEMGGAKGLTPRPRESKRMAIVSSGKGKAKKEIQKKDSPSARRRSSSGRQQQVNAIDHAVLTGLIERLKHSQNKLKSANYRIKIIHPKKVDLFEVIHRRYQLIFRAQ